MNVKRAFGRAHRIIRRARHLSQDDLGAEVSSRSYISVLERGIKSPTLQKVIELAEQLTVHPLTLCALTYYFAGRSQSVSELMRTVEFEALEFLDTDATKRQRVGRRQST